MRFSFLPVALLAAGIPSRTDGFVSPSTALQKSSFVPTANSIAVISNDPKSAQYPVLSSGPVGAARGNTALQMNLFDRFMRVSKANLNKVLSSMEAPEKIMNQAVEDMQNDLVKIRQNYAEVTASQRRLMKRKEDAQAVADKWYARAQLALRDGNEQLAKQALMQRQQYVEAAQSVQSELDIQNTATDKLYDAMKVLEGKINDAKQKKAQYISRAKTAQTTQKVNDMLSGLGTGKTSMDAFQRMEEKVEALEAAAEASMEMSSLSLAAAAPGNKSTSGQAESDIEMEFLRLEGSAAVDEELERMKQNLLPSSTVSEIDNEYLENQIENMKKDATKVSVSWEK